MVVKRVAKPPAKPAPKLAAKPAVKRAAKPAPKPIKDPAAALLKRRVTAVLNISSGGTDAGAEPKMQAIFDAAGLTKAKIHVATAADIEPVLDEAVANSDVLVVLGGDGTIMSAAGKCGACDVLIMPLPGGTMNMLPKALYGHGGWEKALADTLADPQTRIVTGGMAGDRAFYCAAILGTPTLWADVREAFRRFDLPGAAKSTMTAFRRIGGNRLHYYFGDAVKGVSEAVAVICPLVSKAQSENERTLEAVALDPQTAAEAFRLALRAMFEDWRNDPTVERAKVKTVKVTGHGRVPVILDGEIVKMGRSVTITFNPKAFRAITPADAT